MKNQLVLFLLFSTLLMAFSADKRVHEFSYPKLKGTAISISSDNFNKFKKEWRGKDYYYLSDNSKDGVICSVLFYKLNEEEKVMYVDLVQAMVGKDAPGNSSAYPAYYFTTYSNLAKHESNKSIWGDPKDDFMYSQSDIEDYQGVRINQKHMYAYTMFGDGLFVNVHLSKINCTPKDSIAMRGLLDGIKKKK